MGAIPLWIGLPKYSLGIFKKLPQFKKKTEKENSSAMIVFNYNLLYVLFFLFVYKGFSTVAICL